MSGAVSGAQFNFVPRATSSVGSISEENSVGDFGTAGREFKGTRSVAPIASGAFSSQDQALAYRHQGGSVLGAGSKNIGSWLFKSE